ncbi:MAG: glycosyltransferase, partial [Blautia sp.]|nr:glycosyltransferase [Blautia sp.]
DRMKPEIMDAPLAVVRREMRGGQLFRAAGLALTHLLFKLNGDRTFYYRWVLKGIKNVEGYDYAVAYCGPFDLITVYVLYCMKAKRKIQWIHFDVKKFYFNVVMYRRLFQKFHRICVVSEEARAQLIALIPEIAPRTKTVRNRISAKECRRMAALGEGFHDDYKGLRIVTLGRLSAEKGQDIVPFVARILSDRGLVFRWYLIGDGKLREKIESLAAELSVADRISFCGTQINPYPFLQQTDLYIQTSVHEGFGIAIAEAKAFDLPVISTDCTGAYEQLKGRANSRIVGRTAEEIAEAVLEISRELSGK